MFKRLVNLPPFLKDLTSHLTTQWRVARNKKKSKSLEYKHGNVHTN
jgi:hypothetical protein